MLDIYRFASLRMGDETVTRDPKQLHHEVERLRDGCARRGSRGGFPLGVRWNHHENEIEYLYRQGQLICDRNVIEQVLQAFDDADAPRPESVTDGPVGLAILDVGDRDAANLAESLAAQTGDETIVTVNHVMDAQGASAMCPATEPIPASGAIPELDQPVGTGSVRVSVIDTGYHPTVAKESGFERFSAISTFEPDDDVYVPGTSDLRPYGGHGTAATARLLAVAGSESSTVQVRDCLVGGAVDELTLVDDLERVVTAGVDIVSIQAGLHTCHGHPPIAFDFFRRRVLSKHPETIIVTAAGNHGGDSPFWPAAYNWTTAVGALTHGGDARTGWTNIGHWVDVYAPGENVPVPYPNGTYTYLDGTSAPFTNGHARWSGTSFSAPVVAGTIARRMIERDVDAPTARDIVLREAAIAALPTTGPRLVV